MNTDDQSQGAWAADAEAGLPSERFEAEAKRVLELGMEAAPSIRDRSISLFARGNTGSFMGVNTFLSAPYLEDARAVGQYDVAFLGEPLDTGTTYRAGTRFGPQAMRRASALTSLYNFELGMDLSESLTMCDLGDVYVIPANIEKSFDQISQAISHVHAAGAFPVVLGGDHSIGYPNVRGIAPQIEGNIGIIHFDRHSDTDETNMDERMHGTPFFHATNIPNAPPTNLVQIGIGGWLSSRTAVAVSRERRATVITIDDIERLGIARVIELALETAWKGAKTVYLSFDIDSVDPAYAPGTGTPEPGGLQPREVFKLLHGVAREGLCGMEVVEVSPPYDQSDITALLGVRAVLYVLASLVEAGKLGRR
ncbi:MAG TPA: agmatinase family protein [Chloroflexota bacterium]|nr:agmatinase family protein [Chloroflexota bacterium]